MFTPAPFNRVVGSVYDLNKIKRIYSHGQEAEHKKQTLDVHVKAIR